MARCAARDSQHHYIKYLWWARVNTGIWRASRRVSVMFFTKRHTVNKADCVTCRKQVRSDDVCVCVCVCVCWCSQIEDLIIIISKQTRHMKKIRIAWIICLIKQYHLRCLDIRLDVIQHVMHVGTQQNIICLSKYLQFYHACHSNATLPF